jgi:hypothetical protein
MRTDTTLDADLNENENTELVTIARKFGFEKVVSKLIGDDAEEEENEMVFEETGTRLPSHHSSRAVFDTLKSMGVHWGE